jgi:ssDNA-binding Zn-finger/Zn-ribbon topoisomerase 1
MTRQEFEAMDEKCPECGATLLRDSVVNGKSYYKCSVNMRYQQGAKNRSYCSNSKAYEVEEAQ